MTSSPTPAVLPDARALLAQAYQDNGDYGAARYIRAGHDLIPDTQVALLAINDALQRTTPPASDAAVPAGERWTIKGVIAEMRAVAVASIEAEDGDQILEDWPLDCRADVDRWQSVITRALTAHDAAPKVATNTDATPRDQFLQAAFGTGRAGTAHMPDGPYMSMQDAADVHASIALRKPVSEVRDKRVKQARECLAAVLDRQNDHRGAGNVRNGYGVTIDADDAVEAMLLFVAEYRP